MVTISRPPEQQTRETAGVAVAAIALSMKSRGESVVVGTQ